MTSPVRFAWPTWGTSAPQFDLIRAFYPAGFAFPLHSHAFYEISIIESGRGSHLCNQRTEALRENDLFFVHPDDVHAVRALPHHPIHFINIAFPRATVERLAARYRAQAPGPWPWHPGCGNRLLRLDAEDRAWLSGYLRELERPGPAPLAITSDLFIIDLWRRVSRIGAVAKTAGPPGWLVETVEALEDPRRLIEGIPALVRLCGRSREHLGRLVRQHYGCTTIELLARRRMAHAARLLLSQPRRSLSDIAEQCGYDSVSHFHARFRSHYHCTPDAYRQTASAPVPRTLA